MEKALATPDRFVLKPQREGGGNNVYGKSDKGEIVKCRVIFLRVNSTHGKDMNERDHSLTLIWT